jgi:DNA-binding GntR family transcriptional regulator
MADPILLADPPLDSAATYLTKQDYVAACIRRSIMTGKVRPGQHLRQEDVASQLGMSWTPVREAFRLLEAGGWITIERHRGAVVSHLSLPDFEEVYFLRMINEPAAARLAAQHMSEDVLARLTGIHEQIRRMSVSSSADWLEFLRLEREFHHIQYRAADRHRLTDLVMTLRDAAERYLLASLVIDDEPEQHRLVHHQLLRACQRHDGDLADSTMHQALDRVLRRMRPVLIDVLASETTGSPAAA